MTEAAQNVTPSLFEADIDQLTLDPKNARLHPEKNVEMITRSIDELGFGRSILIDEAGQIIAGNGTVTGARKAGKKRVIVVQGDRDTIVAVQRTDLTAEEKTRLALLDNRAGELAKWDAKRIRQIATDNPAQGMLDMFEERDLKRWLAAQEEAQPLAGGGAEEADKELEAAAKTEIDPNADLSKQVAMVQLFLTRATQPLFVARVRELAQRFGTKNITETVEQAIKELHEQLCVPAAPAQA